MVKRVVVFLLSFVSLVAHAQEKLPDLSSGHRIMAGLLYSGAINAGNLDQVMAEITYDLNLPKKGQYDFTTIDVAGFYRLADNVDSQITISVSDVTLDLNGHTVTGATAGISINSNLSSITIKNGTARCTQASSAGIDVGTGCSDIAIENVTAKQARTGVDLFQVVNCTVKNCNFDLNERGININSCANILVDNCIATSNSRYAYDLTSSTTCTVINCKAISTGDRNTTASGTNAEAFGFLADDGYGNLFENCVASSTQNLSATDWDTYVAGFALRGTESCTKIIGCEVGNSTSSASGNTVPFGIWLEGTLSSLVTATEIINQQEGTAFSFTGFSSWSPDGKYFLIPFNDGNGVGAWQLFRYDRDSNTTQLMDELGIRKGAYASLWSPDGNFVVVGDGDRSGFASRTYLYELDRANEKLIERDTQDWDTSTFSLQAVTTFSWSYDGLYLAVAGENSGTAPRWNIKIYEFDRVAKVLIERDQVSFNNATGGDDVYAIAWTHDGRFFTVVGDPESGVSAATYPFDRTTKTAIDADLIAMSPDPAGGAAQSLGCSWSYDDKYIAIVSTLNSSANTRIYCFDGSSFTLVDSIDTSSVLAGNPTNGLRGAKLAWSPDGRYLAVSGTGATTGDIMKLYSFDRNDETLTQLDTYNNGSGLSTISVAWTVDGTSILMASEETSDDIIARIFTGITFPENNVIMNNKVYCNSGGNGPLGVGISGSSIKNTIIGNTAFNNPVLTSVTDRQPSNYQFVTNVFNQLFGDAPTLLQNIEVQSNEPILQLFDLPLALAQMESLTEMLANNLL